MNERLTHIDLFSGIGGFSLAAGWAGFETIAFCENEEYCQKVLQKHWPDVPIIPDIRNFDGTKFRGATLLTGGFPCQDISISGYEHGLNGERSGLWRELLRAISEVRPKYAVVENVANLLAGGDGRWFGRVLGDLAEIGYDTEWHCVSASEVGAFHKRERVWIIAHTNPCNLRLQRIGPSSYWEGGVEQLEGLVQDALLFSVPSGKCGGVVDGVSNRTHRLKALGNAIVPQVAYEIIRCKAEIESKYYGK